MGEWLLADASVPRGARAQLEAQLLSLLAWQARLFRRETAPRCRRRRHDRCWNRFAFVCAWGRASARSDGRNCWRRS